MLLNMKMIYYFVYNSIYLFTNLKSEYPEVFAKPELMNQVVTEVLKSNTLNLSTLKVDDCLHNYLIAIEACASSATAAYLLVGEDESGIELVGELWFACEAIAFLAYEQCSGW